MITSLQTKNAPEAIGPYSQAVVYNGLLFVSGQIPLDPKSGAVVSGGICEQAAQVLANLDAILLEAGTGRERVLKTTCFLADMADFAQFNAVYADYFVSKPARSCVAVRQLPRDVLCEIELIAAIGDR